MVIDTYLDLQKEIQQYYNEAEYSTALDLIEGNISNFPAYKNFLYYWKMVLLSAQNEIQDALAALKIAIGDGFWLNDNLLLLSPALDCLQNEPEFEVLLQINQQNRKVEETSLFPLLTMRPEGECISEEKPCPLLLGFHANGSTAHADFDFWSAAAKKGYLVAAPQSFQGMWKGAYSWDDRQLALVDINKHFASLQKNYHINESDLILAGVAGGAHLALCFSLSRQFKSRGFILINPEPAIIDLLDICISPAVDYPSLNIRGFIIYGETVNSNNHQVPLVISTNLRQIGIECETEQIRGAGAAYEQAYSDSLLAGLIFVSRGLSQR